MRITKSNKPSAIIRRERCPSGLRSTTGNRVSAERRIAGSNPALSVVGVALIGKEYYVL
jgi:hypothetical protein